MPHLETFPNLHRILSSIGSAAVFRLASLLIFCMTVVTASANGWSQSTPGDYRSLPTRLPSTETDEPGLLLPSGFGPSGFGQALDSAGDPDLQNLFPAAVSDSVTSVSTETPAPTQVALPDPPSNLQFRPIAEALAEPDTSLPSLTDSPINNAFATSSPGLRSVESVRTIPAYIPNAGNGSHRIVRYDVPLDDHQWHEVFNDRGWQGHLVEVADPDASRDKSISARLRTFLNPSAAHRKEKKIRMVRYEVPADDISFHASASHLKGQLLEPGMLRLPEVRFFQPKARVFIDMKRDNDNEFDLFDDGAILASLDVIELYFPMPLISERFAELFGKPGRLSSLGWRVGGTVGLGITTALNNGSSDNGSAPVSTLSTGIRYEFPLGRPSRELLESGDTRLDQRTRVGMEFGFQGGVSTRESLGDATDYGMYFGILVNTPWGG